eukprot:9756320-Alexandrium_andersonii.AAC.1
MRGRGLNTARTSLHAEHAGKKIRNSPFAGLQPKVVGMPQSSEVAAGGAALRARPPAPSAEAKCAPTAFRERAVLRFWRVRPASSL